jgi:hypothetical protein
MILSPKGPRAVAIEVCPTLSLLPPVIGRQGERPIISAPLAVNGSGLIVIIVIVVIVVWENVEVVADNEPSDQDGDAGDTENYGLASVSGSLRFCRCPIESKTSSTEYEDEGYSDPKLRGRHRFTNAAAICSRNRGMVRSPFQVMQPVRSGSCRAARGQRSGQAAALLR